MINNVLTKTDGDNRSVLTVKRQRLTRTVIIVSAALLPIIMLAASDWLRASVTASLEICVRTLIPSLFPFILANDFFTYSGAAETIGRPLSGLSRKIFLLGGSMASAILTGLICGYPSGAACAFGLYTMGLCTSDEAERCAAFANNAGPSFVIGGVGGALLGDMRLGIIIWCSSVIASLTAGFFLRFTARDYTNTNSHPIKKEVKANLSITHMISDAALIMLKICAFAITFGALSDAAAHIAEMLGVGNTVIALIHGIFEFAAAANYAALNLAPEAAAIVIAAAVSWSGLCVHCQTSVLRPDGLSMKRYYIVKLCTIPISAALCALMIKIF